MLHPILALAWATVVDPRSAAITFLRHVPDRAHLIEGMILVSVLGVLVTWMTVPFGPELGDDMISNLIRAPLLLGVVQAMLGFLSAIFTHLIGRMFGGAGDLDSSLMVVVWLNFVIILIELVGLPFYLFGQALSGLVNLLTALFAVWLSVNFIAVLHGFRSLLLVFAGMVGVTLALMFLLLLLVGTLGTTL